jgi:purine-binding chemotaxis protein CheW
MSENVNSLKKSKSEIINWDEIKMHLELGNQLLANNRVLSNEQKKKILKDRAKEIAIESKNNASEENNIEVIKFSLAYEIYGIETLYVREVFPLKELTFLPSMPAFLLGITNVRGRILPVIDIKSFFNLPEKGLTDLNKLIILHSEDFEIAVLADLIIDVLNINLAALQPYLPTLTGIRADLLKGVTMDGVIILDGKKILNDKRIIINDKF